MKLKTYDSLEVENSDCNEWYKKEDVQERTMRSIGTASSFIEKKASKKKYLEGYILFGIKPKLKEKIKEASKKYNISMSSLIRTSIEYWIESMKQEERIK